MVEEKKQEEKGKIEDKKAEEKVVETKEELEEKKDEGKAEEKKSEEVKRKEVKEKKEKKIGKKEEAKARGKDLNISTKHSVAICRFIKNKRIEKAIFDLEQVIKKKKAIPMKGEIPHRKGKGMERGRYPVKACKVFIKLLKDLAANSIVNGLEEPYIYIAKADKASRPYRRFGSRRFKRTHVLLVARDRKFKGEAKREEKKEREKGKNEEVKEKKEKKIGKKEEEEKK